MEVFYTYIAYNTSNDIIDIGTTLDLKRRLKLFKLKRQCACKIVYIDAYNTSNEATKRENELLQYHKKIIRELVLSTNPLLVNLINNDNE